MKKQYIKFSRRAISMLLAAACAGMMLTGCGQETVEEETVSELIPVEVQSPEAGTLTLKNEFVGTVSPEEFVYVIPLVSAEVLSADVAVGDTVVAGQELCKLDSEAAELQLASAQAQYDSVEANVDAAQVGYQIAQAQYESALAQIDVQNEQTQRQKDLQLYQMQIQIDSINSGIDDINEQMADLSEDKRDAEEKKDDLKKAKNQANAYAKQAEAVYNKTLDAYKYDDAQAAYQMAVAAVTALEPEDEETKQDIIQNQYGGSEENYKQAVEKAKEELKTAGDNLKKAETEIEYYKESMDRARAAVSQTESAYEQVEAGIESIEDGQEQLGDTLSDTYKSLEQTEAIKNMTEASLNIDTTPVQDASKKTAALGVDSAAATVNSAKVGAEGAKIAIDSAEYQLDMYTLTAPIDGVIEAVNVKEHDFASPNGPAFVISNKNTMTVTFYVSEGIRSTLRVGQKIQVDRNGRQYDAAITEIGTMIDQNTGLFAVKSCVSTPDDSLLTGSSVKVIADTYSQNEALLIPYDAVYYDDSQPYVYVAVDGIARRKDVETGIFDAETITILSGLDAADVLITSWSANLRDGAEISVQQQNGK